MGRSRDSLRNFARLGAHWPCNSLCERPIAHATVKSQLGSRAKYGTLDGAGRGTRAMPLMGPLTPSGGSANMASQHGATRPHYGADPYLIRGGVVGAVRRLRGLHPQADPLRAEDRFGDDWNLGRGRPPTTACAARDRLRIQANSGESCRRCAGPTVADEDRLGSRRSIPRGASGLGPSRPDLCPRRS